MKRKNNDRDKNRKEFLLSFFDKPEYQEKEVNNFILVKVFSGFEWTVRVFTKKSFEKTKNFNTRDHAGNKLFNETKNMPKDIT